MTRLVLLDAGPLGLLCHPGAGEHHHRCAAWLARLMDSGVQVTLPEIVDYEVRRELLRINSMRRVRLLDDLSGLVFYAELTAETMRLAAEFWARARRLGRPTADDRSLDCDMVLAVQAEILRRSGFDTVIATTNVRHLGLVTAAAEWESIT